MEKADGWAWTWNQDLWLDKWVYIKVDSDKKWDKVSIKSNIDRDIILEYIDEYSVVSVLVLVLVLILDSIKAQCNRRPLIFNGFRAKSDHHITSSAMLKKNEIKSSKREKE